MDELRIPESGPLELDLGCGKGGFLASMAQQFPDVFFVGIERQSDRVLKTGKKITRLGLTNAAVFQGEILESLAAFPAGRVDVIHVLFPDPWPKRKHQRRRLMGPAFLDAAFRALRPGGWLRFATDDIAYFRAARAVIEVDPRFAAGDPPPVDYPRTDFQRLFEAQGKPSNSLMRRKVPETP